MTVENLFLGIKEPKEQVGITSSVYEFIHG